MSKAFSWLKKWMDRGDSYELLEAVRNEVGYNRDVEVEEEFFKECDRLERSSRTYVDLLYEGAEVYRDEKPTTSLHVTDFRGSKREGIGAHLEFFNPEYHPFLHLLDVALWHLKDSVERGDEPVINREQNK